jgi:peptide/nickel transport system ATP-binding protein
VIDGPVPAEEYSDDDVLLRVEDLVVQYKSARGQSFQAVSKLSFDIRRGETLGLVGETGCGKSTAAKAILMLQRPAEGRITFEGRDLFALSGKQARELRRRLQLVFQDPISSLNPRRKVKDIVGEGLAINKVKRPWGEKVSEALRAVGLDPEVFGDRRPGELSGGQCQRVAIARVLVLEPSLIVCDEPVSSLDVSIQAQILNLLEDMKARYQLTMLFIAHDLAVVKNISDRVAVMYLGKLCEMARSDEIYLSPQHPYTQALLSAVPIPDPFAPEPPMLAQGDVPSQIDPPSGCRFRTRCPYAQERCATEEPLPRPVGPGHYVACHFPGLAGAPPPAEAASGTGESGVLAQPNVQAESSGGG